MSSGLHPSDVFNAVLDPDWDEICKLPPGESDEEHPSIPCSYY
jgi:hypothetical protein